MRADGSRPRGTWRVTELRGGDPGKIKGEDQWPRRLQFHVSPPGLQGPAKVGGHTKARGSSFKENSNPWAPLWPKAKHRNALQVFIIYAAPFPSH